MYVIECIYCKKKVEINRKPDNKRGKYCSALCASKDYHSKPKIKKQMPPNVKCAWCDVGFYKNKSRQDKSKSGLFFCCRKHKDLAQRMEGLDQLHPSHYGTSERPKDIYRRIAFENYPRKCNRCGYDEYIQLLDVHHIDENPLNNIVSNLEILCVMCHKKHHYGLK